MLRSGCIKTIECGFRVGGVGKSYPKRGSSTYDTFFLAYLPAIFREPLCKVVGRIYVGKALNLHHARCSSGVIS